MPVTNWHAELAWLGGEEVAADVLLSVRDGRFADVTAMVADPPADAIRLPGLTLPGLANAHSHAFHRALRGRTHGGQGDFWTWREQMYAVAEVLDPELYLDLARATYAEMALAGITTVGEFHYLHHDFGGRTYSVPNVMGEALIEAAREAGIRMTLLDACYLQGGVSGQRLAGPQLRFGDSSAESWAERAAALTPSARVRIGAAIHSVRAVPVPALERVASWAADRHAPLHFHLSEQRRENEDAVAVTGCSPTALLADAGAVTSASTAVHATHLGDDDVRLLTAARTCICMCPTTERDLADGIGPASRLATLGSPLSLGSDSHAVIDLFEEARAVELDERLASEQRGHHRAAALVTAATAGGADCLGWADAGRLRAGQLADFVSVRLTSPRLAGADRGTLLAATVFAATGADVANVVVGGQPVVVDGVHQQLGDVGRLLASAITRVWARVAPAR